MLPEFIIIGTMKGGTTSLHYYLSQHPEIFMSKQKELNFFIEERNWRRGLKWYESHFNGAGRMRGEASPNYTDYPRFEGVPERMHWVVPQAKLIYVLRDPIERMISHYVHVLSDGLETRNPQEALSDPGKNAFVARSQYYMQLTQFLEFYPKSNILIITHEDLLLNRRETLERIFRFLEVDDTFHSPRFKSVRHKSEDKRIRNKVGRFLINIPNALRLERLSPVLAHNIGYALSFPFSRAVTRPQIDVSLRRTLVEKLEADTNRLRAFTGRTLEEWSV